MKRLSVLVGFVAGCLMLVGAFTLGETTLMALVGALLAMILFLAAMGILSKGKDRWRTLAMDGVLLLGFGVLIFDPVVLTPLGLFLLVFSLFQLRRVQTKHGTS